MLGEKLRGVRMDLVYRCLEASTGGAGAGHKPGGDSGKDAFLVSEPLSDSEIQ